MPDPDIRKTYVVRGRVTPMEAETYNEVRANLTAVSEPDATLSEFIQEIKTASVDPIYKGKPRMLHVTAVIVHEGVNLNRDGFYKEDLEKAVSEKKLFKMGYGGMIDVNHDFMPVGYWYDSEIVVDPVTNSTAILAKGAVWAWRFPEVADKILADQYREGHISVSMTCVARSEDITYSRDEYGETISWIRDPVFVATTILFDTPAGDPNARGVAEEDPVHITDKERQQTLLSAAAKEDNQNTENTMLDELKPLLEEKLGDNAESVIAAITQSFNSLEERLSARDTEMDSLRALNAELTEQTTELQTTIDDQALALESLTSAKEELEATIAEQLSRIEAYEAREAEIALENKKASRLSEVSASVREKLEQRDPEVREAILNRWANQSDEEWETTKAEHALAAETSADRPLPGAGSRGVKSLSEYLR